ncbi:MAG: OmpA family protein [Deltaproteobacteria bacterium]|jgi:OOP family OmpA-OmpF porin|nr:OmpA family protein [Deltaproteobacteria bacterium]
MNKRFVLHSLLGAAIGVLLLPRPAAAINISGMAKMLKSSAGDAARDKAVKDINAKLLAEGRKNQCSFKSDTDELAPGCNAKLKRLANALVKVKQNLKVSGVTNYKFEVSGHTDSSGSAEHNKELSAKRAAVIARELVARGIDKSEIISVGRGSERPVVTPDNTPAKKAKNRRYEIQVRF